MPGILHKTLHIIKAKVPVSGLKPNKPRSKKKSGHKETKDVKRDGIFTKVLKSLRSNLLLVLTVLGVIAGLIMGFAIRPLKPSELTVTLIMFPGDLLMSMLKMLILPLIVSSLLSGLAQLDPKSSGKVGIRALIYFLSTSFLAVALGIILCVAIHPGNPNVKKAFREEREMAPKTTSTLDAFLDLIRNMFPENLIQACFQSVGTVYRNITLHTIMLNGSDNLNKTLYIPFAANATKDNGIIMEQPRSRVVTVKELEYDDNMNVLGLITFSTAFGIILAKMGDTAELMIRLVTIFNDVIMRIVMWIMWYSPIGIMFLIAGKIVSIDDVGELIEQLGMYVLTMFVGLSLWGLVILPFIYFAITKLNPYTFLKGMLQAIVTALGTASSSATLPVTFRCVEDNLNVDKRVTRFVLPVGATINMDGTAMYEAIAPIFIAQINGIVLRPGQYITICFTAFIASIGAASVPSAGLVTMMLVLTSVGLPIKDIGLIVAVDWLVDRGRTIVNVLGDAIGAGIIDFLSRDEMNTFEDEKAMVNSMQGGKGNVAYDDDLNDGPDKESYYSGKASSFVSLNLETTNNNPDIRYT